jgi:hypothetical protein
MYSAEQHAVPVGTMHVLCLYGGFFESGSAPLVKGESANRALSTRIDP